MSALDTLRAIARSRSERPQAYERNERNERNERSGGEDGVISFNSLAGSDEKDNLDERAALVEEGAGVPREWAEGLSRLDPNHPPGDVPLRRWQCFVDDVGRFLDSQFCAVAVALGWGPHDLFGCDARKPFARIDQAGLLWLLNGNKLVALSENTVAIEMPTGARQTYRPKPAELTRVLAWELTPLIQRVGGRQRIWGAGATRA
jgi:hypothetical protein